MILVEHDMDVIAASDWVIDIGAGGGEHGGQIVDEGLPADIARSEQSRPAPYLAK